MAAAHRLYVIQWRDAHMVRGEDTREDVLRAHNAAMYWTAGILVHSDHVGITVAQDVSVPQVEDDVITYRTRTFIPRELVVNEFDAGALLRRTRRRRGPSQTDHEV